MSKISIIIQREYLRRVNRKSFLLITLLTPLLIVGVIAVPIWLSGVKTEEIKKVVIIDSTEKYSPLFKNTSHYHFIKSVRSIDEYRENPDKDIFAILNIADDLSVNPNAASLYSEKHIPFELSGLVNHTLSEQIELDKLASFDIPDLKKIIEETKVNFNIQTIKWGSGGTENVSSSHIASIIGILFTTLIYFFIMMYGGMVMQGVTEEKSNRIVEVIISSVRPFELMMGKIIGILFVGLTQLFLWASILFAIFLFSQKILSGSLSPEELKMLEQGMAISSNQSGNEVLQMLQSVNWLEVIISFILFFTGGFLLYASIFAALGSAVDQQEDTQQFMIPVTFLLLFALYAGIYSGQNPDGPLAFWCSIIPFTSPIVMMVRLPFDVPLWQTLLSLVILYGSTAGIIWIAAKIYRTGILMYGKKPSLKEIIKWINYK